MAHLRRKRSGSYPAPARTIIVFLLMVEICLLPDIRKIVPAVQGQPQQQTPYIEL